MKKTLIISLATGTLLLAGCQKDEPAPAEDTAEVEAVPADDAEADAPADSEEPAEEAE